MIDAQSPLYVASDIHGHRDEFRACLVDGGLVDEAGQWTGRDARLWLLGDYVDRGPDGLGVIEDIQRLTNAAGQAGGQVRALLGNHEVQLLAAHHFGITPVAGLDEPAGFEGGWARFGGRHDELRRLTPAHVEWMSGLAAVAVVGGYLLAHSDTTEYLSFGADVGSANAAVANVLACRDSMRWVELSDRISDRGAFRNGSGDAVTSLLRAYGGHTLVHGHSTLTKHFAVAPDTVREALRYAGGRVIAVDGGVY
ncbi:metallophosphoesterase [Micromonosporaceae bacterium Da 78-11]